MKIDHTKKIKYPGFIDVPSGIEGYDKKWLYAMSQKDECKTPEYEAAFKHKYIKALEQSFDLIKLTCLKRAMIGMDDNEILSEKEMAENISSYLETAEKCIQAIFTHFEFYPDWYSSFEDFHHDHPDEHKTSYDRKLKEEYS